MEESTKRNKNDYIENDTAAMMTAMVWALRSKDPSTQVGAVFLNEEGRVICFEARAVANSKNYLLIKKDALLDYLKKHHKKILWYVLGEKNIIGIHDHQSVPNLPMWLVINGTYTLDDTGRITGSLRTSHER